MVSALLEMVITVNFLILLIVYDLKDSYIQKYEEGKIEGGTNNLSTIMKLQLGKCMIVQMRIHAFLFSVFSFLLHSPK